MKKILATYSLLFFTCYSALSQNIITVAGDSVGGFSGDGGQATAAELNWANDMTMDASGSYYIADESNERVREVNGLTGVITTVAGNGAKGYNGDSIQATDARLNLLSGVVVDNSGNLYIADRFNNRVRKVVLSTGIITTYAGNGTASYSGDGGPATAAELNGPITAGIDTAGNLFIADYNNHRIRKIDALTGIITTVAGNGIGSYSGDGGAATAAELNGPYYVRVDAVGNMIISDDNNNRIRRVDAITGIITTIAGNGVSGWTGDGGQATAAELNDPNGTCFDNSGNLIIADWGNNRIRKLDMSTGIITPIAGNGVGNFSGDGGAATAAELKGPSAMSVDATGNIYIADTHNNRIRKISISTGIDEIKQSDKLTIYPNPNSGIFTVTLSHTEFVSAPQTIVEIYNVMGQKVKLAPLKPMNQVQGGQVQGNNLIDLSSQPKGIYLYRVIATDGTLIGEGKVIIE
jgi:sugar lactone lactonase YvrE